MKRLLLVALLALPSWATVVRLDHNFVNGTGNPSTVTTPNMNCTGGNFVVAWVVYFGGNTAAAAVTSSPSNTWLGTTRAAGANSNGTVFYAFNAAVSGTLTVTVTSGVFPSVFAACYSGVLASGDPLDQISTSTAPISCQAGSITPSQDNELIIAGVANAALAATPYTLTGYTVLDQSSLVSGMAEGGADAELIQTTAGATNPTWSQASATDTACVILSFKAATASTYVANPTVIVVGP